jgi:hypothetical protein
MLSRWENPFELTRYGERVAVDVYAVAGRIGGLIEAHGFTPDLDDDGIASSILGFLQLRQRMRADKIRGPKRPRMTKPADWDDEQEQIWVEHIAHLVSVEDWRQQVMYPVFGTSVRIWEGACDGWREEILQFLPAWIQRSYYNFDRIDPRQLPSSEEIEEAERREASMRKRLGIRVKDVDPYLAEQEERRGRGRY